MSLQVVGVRVPAKATVGGPVALQLVNRYGPLKVSPSDTAVTVLECRQGLLGSLSLRSDCMAIVDHHTEVIGLGLGLGLG